MNSFFLSRFDDMVSSMNHCDLDGEDWVDTNKIGGLAQSIPEWRAFLGFVSSYFNYRNIRKPIVLEIGTQDNYQKQFYEEFLNAEHIGIDIDPKAKGGVDILGNSHDKEIIEKVKDRLAGRMIDLTFIDGDHSYDGTKEDYEIYSPMTKHLVAIHDVANTYVNPAPHLPPVETHILWREICYNEKNHMLITFQKNRKHEREPWINLGIGLVVKDGKG